MADKVNTTEKFVFFWGGWPSQWAKSPFEIDGITYNCCEQFMMAEKARVFGDPAIEAEILTTGSPATQKALGRKVSGFDAEAWNSVCRGIVYRGNLVKYEQNDELRELLLKTGRRTIVEASPRDRIWGIGMGASNPMAEVPTKWRGRNWLGIAIQQVREEIKRREGLTATDLDRAMLEGQLEARMEMTNG